MLKKKLFGGLLMFSVFVSTGNVFAADAPFVWPDAYTIEYTQTGYGDPMRNIHSVTGNKVRIESVTKNGKPGDSVTIFDLDNKLMLDLFPSQRKYRQRTYSTYKNHMFNTDGIWEKVGSEKVNGVAADQYKITYADKPNGSIFVWLSVDRQFPLKVTKPEKTMEIEIHKFTVGNVDQGQFAVPASYSPHSY